MNVLNSLSNLDKAFQLYISKYKLRFRNNNGKPPFLEGALLAFEFQKGLVGYSDFLPWPTFGEQNLFQQLNQMKKGLFSQRFEIAKYNAFLDAQARALKKNLFFGLKIPASHFLIEDLLSFKNPEWIFKKGFQIIKVKLKPYEISKQISALKKLNSSLKNIRWRLDLNGGKWETWKNHLEFLHKAIDLIEDPLLEKKLQTAQSCNLFAQDWLNSSSFPIKIVKPSKDCLKNLIKQLAFFRWKRLIFTHSLDHPLGQVVSAFWAGQFYKNYSRFFETGAFVSSSLVHVDSYPLKIQPNFSAPSGFGFGFGDSLEKEAWKRWI